MRKEIGLLIVSAIIGILSAGCGDTAEGDETEEDVTAREEAMVAGCTFLGRNQYCDGTTLVLNYDMLCYNAIDEQRVETRTYFIPDGIGCEGL